MTTSQVTQIRVVHPGSSPDVDSDFNTKIRDQVYEHVQNLYGYDKVSNIATQTRFGAKKAFKSMCSIYGVAPLTANKITALIPPPIEGVECSIKDAFDPTSSRYSEAAEFRAATEDDSWTTIIEGAKAVEGRISGSGVHACGVIMSSHALTEVIPTRVRRSDGRVLTQWAYPECESLGLIKMDFLGLDTVDLIQDSVEYVKRSGKTPPNMLEIIHGPMDDEKTFKLLQRGDTIGIFQLAGSGVQDLLRKMQPTSIDDIAAATALYRPGPMGMLSHVRYAERKSGREELGAPIHEDFIGSPLEKILAGTQNLCVFQEQVIQIANQIAGMTLQEGDDLRKAMGKKKVAAMAAMKPKFMDGARENGYSDEAITRLWDTIAEFSKYGFNKCAAGSTKVALASGGKATLADLYNRQLSGEKIQILSMFENGEIKPHTIKKVVKTGRKPLYSVKTASGRTIRITEEHRMLTTSGYGTIADGTLIPGAELMNDAEWTKRLKAETTIGGFKPEAPRSETQSHLSLQLANANEALAAEYMISRGVDFELHKTVISPIGTTRVSDFYANGVYYEMDGLQRGRQYFVENKYGEETPFVYMTPQNYKDEIDASLMSRHAVNGDAIVEIVAPKVLPSGSILNESTYDVEMEDSGPSNFIAEGLVSHNSHSYSYAVVAYQSAWLKANHPVEFMAALLATNVGRKEKILAFLKECRRMGITVGAADINRSAVRVAPNLHEDGPSIVYGLSGIDSVSESTAEAIIREREENGEYTSLTDVVDRYTKIDVARKNVLVNLAHAGAFDSFGLTRYGAVSALGQLLSDSKVKAKRGNSLFDLFGDEEETQGLDYEITDEEYPFSERVGHEAAAIGLYITAHPLERVGKEIGRISNTRIKNLLNSKSRVRGAVIAGAITDMESKIMSRGKSVSVTIDDGTGYLNARLIPDLVKAVDKASAQQAVKKLYMDGASKISDFAAKAVRNTAKAAKPIEKNKVYSFVVDFMPSFEDEGEPRVRVLSISPVSLAHDGTLPIRMRFDFDSERNQKLFKPLPAKIAERWPGDSAIHVAQYNSSKPPIEADQVYLDALKVLEAGTGSEGKKTPREWPPAQTGRPKDYEITQSTEELAMSVDYEDTGLRADKTKALELAIEKYLGVENYDLGALDSSLME